MPVEDYPQLPAMPQLAGAVPGEQLAQAVQQVAVAAGRDDTLPMLTGIRLEIDGPRLTLAATDRFRLAVRELEWAPADPTLSTAVLVPARTLAEVGEDARRRRRRSSSRCRRATGCSASPVAAGGRPPGCSTRSSRGSASSSPPSTPAQPSSRPRRWWRRSSGSQLVTDRVAQVRMEFGDEGLRLAAGGDEVGSAEEELPCELDGSPLTIAFNPAYLLDALGALQPRGRS